MGVVYRARHVLIDRIVAVKLIRPDLRGETHLRAWMLREARAANRVDHAHIIDIHDIGETEEGELYLVMEYLVGTSLSSELARGSMPLARGVDILEQMCAALARAHDLGVVHRDLKSDNILAHDARRPERLREDPRLRARPPGDGPAPRAEGRGLRDARVHGARAGARRRGDAAERSLRARRPLLRDAHRAAALPQRRPRDAARDAAHGHRPAAAVDQAGRPARGRGASSSGSSRRTGASASRTRTISTKSSRRCSAACRARRGTSRRRATTSRRRRRRRRRSPGVIEWASRAALFSRMVVARVPDGQRARRTCRARSSQAWDLAVARHAGSRARSRATRASSRRSSGAGARCARRSAARSRSSRTKSRARCASCRPSRPRSTRLREALLQAEKVRRPGEAGGRSGERRRRRSCARSSSARAPPWRPSRPSASSSRSTSRRPLHKDAQARDLRRQIEELRAQLARYAEALEEDLASGREKVADAHARGHRVREGVQRGLDPAPRPPEGQAGGARPPAGAHRRHARPELQHAREKRQPRADLIARLR